MPPGRDDLLDVLPRLPSPEDLLDAPRNDDLLSLLSPPPEDDLLSLLNPPPFAPPRRPLAQPTMPTLRPSPQLPELPISAAEQERAFLDRLGWEPVAEPEFEPEPTFKPWIPADVVVVGEAIYSKEYLAERAGEKSELIGNVKRKYLPWTDPLEPGISPFEGARRREKYPTLVVALAGGEAGDLGRERTEIRLSQMQAQRLREVLGAPPEEIDTAVDWATWSEEHGGYPIPGQAGQPLAPGILDPFVAIAAYGANRDGRSPHLVDAGVLRLTKLTLETPEGKKPRLMGVDLDKLREITGGQTLDMARSLLLLSVAARARDDAAFAKLLTSGKMRELLGTPLSTFYDIDTTRPEGIATGWAQARKWATSKIRDLEEWQGGGAYKYMRFEKDGEGNIVPATYAEDPDYWDRWVERAPLGELATRRAWADRHETDPVLRAKLAHAHEERRPISAASWGEAAKNMPASAGRFVVGTAQLLASAPVYLFNALDFLGQYAADEALYGKMTQETKEHGRRVGNAHNDALEAAGTMATALWDDARGIVKWLTPFETMDERKYLKWQLEMEHDPMRAAIMVALVGKTAFQVGGALSRVHKLRLAGVEVKTLLEGAKAGGKLYHELQSKLLLAGPKALVGGVGRLQGWKRGRALKTQLVGAELNARGFRNKAELNGRIKELLTLRDKLTTEHADASVSAAVNAELATVTALGGSLTQLEGAIGQLASAPYWGRWLKSWLLRPDAIDIPQLFEKYYEGVANKGLRQSYKMGQELETRLERLSDLGAGPAEARRVSLLMIEGMGPFAGKVAWDVNRPYGAVAAKAIEAATAAGGKFRVGKLEFDLAKLAETGDVQSAVEAVIAKEMQNYAPEIKAPVDFERIVTETAKRENITPGVAALKWVSQEMERLRAQKTRPAAAVGEDFALGKAPGPQIARPEMRYDKAAKRRWFEWGGTEYDIKRISTKKRGTGATFYAVHSKGFPIDSTMAKTPQKAFESFLGQHAEAAGTPGARPIPVLELPEITGVSPEAVQFGLAVQWSIGRAGGKVGGVDSSALAGFYQQVLDASPLLSSLPKDGWTRHAVGLHLMRELYPRLTLDPHVSGSIRLHTSKGIKEVPIQEVLSRIGEPVQDLSPALYRAGMKAAEAGLLSIDQVMSLGLRYFHRQLTPGARKSVTGALRRFAHEPERYTGLSKAERREYLAGLSESAGAKKAKAPGKLGKRGDFRLREMETGISMLMADLIPGGNPLRSRGVATGTALPGEVGGELYPRLFQTSRTALVQGIAGSVLMEGYSDMLLSLRGTSEHIGGVLEALTGTGILSPEVKAFVEGKVGKVIDEMNPAQRMAAAIDLLRSAEAISVPEAVRARMMPLFEAAGLKPLKTFETGAYRVPDWQKSVFVTPEVQLHFERGSRGAMPHSTVLQRLTQVIKQNQIVFQSGTWVRDVFSNITILGPANGLMPQSRAWRTGFRAAEGHSFLSNMLKAEGMQGGSLTETGFLGGDAPAGLGRRVGAAMADAWRDLEGTLAGPDRVLHLAGEVVSTLGRLSVAPGKTGLGRFLQYERMFTDFAPRSALFAQRIAKAVAGNAEFNAGLRNLARKHGVKPKGRNLTMPWAAEEAVLGTIERIAGAAEKKAYLDARRSVSKGKAHERGAAARDAVYNETYGKAFELLDDAGRKQILREVKDAFVNYDDVPRYLDRLRRNPFGPIYLTFSSQAIPMLVKWFNQHPVKALGLRTSYEVVSNIMWHMSGGEGSVRDFEKSAPWWAVPVPFMGDMDFWSGAGPRVGPAAFDMAFFTPFSMSADVFNPLLSPAGSTLLEAAQLFTGEGTPYQMFPLKRGPERGVLGMAGGPALAEPTAGPLEKALQLAFSEYAKFAPAVSPVTLGQAAAMKFGGIQTGPLPAGMRAPSTWQPLVESLGGPSRSTQEVPSTLANMLRIGGFRVIPAGEDAAMARFMIPELVTEQERAEAKATGGTRTRERSVLGYTVNNLKKWARQPLKRVAAQLEGERTREEVGRRRKLELGPGEIDPQQQMKVRLAGAQAFHKAASGRVEQIYDSFREAMVYEWRNTSADERFLRSDQLQKVFDVTLDEVLDRWIEVQDGVLEEKTRPLRDWSEDIEYVLQPIGDVLGTGVTGEPATTMRFVDDVIPLLEKWKDARAPTTPKGREEEERRDVRTVKAVQQYRKQAQTYPEATIRAGVKRKKGPKLLMGAAAEPLDTGEEP